MKCHTKYPSQVFSAGPDIVQRGRMHKVRALCKVEKKYSFPVFLAFEEFHKFPVSRIYKIQLSYSPR